VEETKAFLAGVPEELVRDDVVLPARRVDPRSPDPDAPWPFTWEEGQRDVPILLSPLVATVWNTAFAESFNLPRMSREEWIGREVELVLGWRVRMRGVVAGFSRRVDVVGAPLSLVEHLNRSLAPDRPSSPGRVHVKVESQRHLATVVARLEEEGWYVTDEGETGRKVSRGLRIGEAALGLVGVALVVVSLVNLSTVLLLGLRERRYELAVLRAYGAGRGVIGAALALQTGLIGALGALLGLALAFGCAYLVDLAVLPLLEPALGKVGSLFHLPAAWAAGTLLGGTLAALASSVQPSLAAGRMNVAEVLRR
jgi:predicted lysophospholipase L1 biosynthesis ABC-type transport system permease subunit